ncbi:MULTISPECIES: DUF3802 family protein [unclassified Photobacterium]|uniref:DUF3802 family protein n=1 Tax=unclassified Photobacterium TaxID=2628852 RepID=UPI001B8B4D06|nr:MULTISPECIES: DUF3802 family protein [unclassified Photobacterium]MDO6705390.1 DUF3802 family protein [Photobacterium sp. 1_MG-2023]QUJ68770.1 DUF3802 family protein [Photobacterium sp. GJ3]
MVVESEGYHALIEYFSENLHVFEESGTDASEETVENVVTDLIATNLMAVFNQNPDLKPDFRFKLMQEADAVLEDLSEILGGLWLKHPGVEQISFLEDYISLVKNLFDSVISEQTSFA